MVEQFILLVEYSEKEPEPAHAGSGSDKTGTAVAEKPATAKEGKTTFKAYGAFETAEKATAWAHDHDLGANVKNFTAVTMLTPVN